MLHDAAGQPEIEQTLVMLAVAAAAGGMTSDQDLAGSASGSEMPGSLSGVAVGVPLCRRRKRSNPALSAASKPASALPSLITPMPVTSRAEHGRPQRQPAGRIPFDAAGSRRRPAARAARDS